MFHFKFINEVIQPDEIFNAHWANYSRDFSTENQCYNSLMPFLIDGHNLIPKIPGLNLQTVDDEIALIEYLQGFCQRTGKKVEVFFDNAPPGYSGTRKYGNVTTHFVRAGTTADDAIRQRLSRLKGAAKNWTVISSDRQVQAEARGVGAEVIPSEVFATGLMQNRKAETKKGEAAETLSPEEVAEWLVLFSGKGKEQ